MKSIFLILLIASSLSTFAQNSIRFKVMEENGTPLVGVNVIIVGTVTGATSNQDGVVKFSNLADEGNDFRFSFLGFEEKLISLSFPEDHNKLIEVELEEDEEELEEVIIATTRSSRTIEDIPTRIEAITGEELSEKANMNSTNIGMLLRETTGIIMQQTSLSSGNLSIRIQGLDGRYTQLLKDGFPLYGGFAGGLSIMQIPPLDLKQVELIKGSSSTLYGGGAIAGLVNLITITPEDDPELNIMLNLTSALGITGNAFYAQRYGKTGLSIYTSANKQIEYDPDDDGFSNIPSVQSFTVNPRFYVYFNPNTELYIGLNTTFDNRTGGDMEVLKGNVNEDHTYSEQNVSQRYSSQLGFINNTESRTITLKNSFNYFNRELTIPGYRFNGEQLSGFTELVYSLHKRKSTEWQFGLNHYLEMFREDKVDSIIARDYTYNTLGGFVQNTCYFGPLFTLELGLRTDYNVQYGVFVLPRVSMLFRINEKLAMRLGGGMGYKLPTIFTEEAERIKFENIEPLVIEDVLPETSIGGNFDINYKTIFLREFTFSINQLFFVTGLNNSLVLRESSTEDTYYYENADGPVISFGFETNTKFTYNDFKLFLNYAYTNTQLNYDNINNQKPLTPYHKAGFILFYEKEDNLSIGYELYYTGNQFDEFYDKKTDFWTMGIMVMKQLGKFSVFINFENFTNVLQTDFEPLVIPPYTDPIFPEIWAPTDGFIINGGFKFSVW
jgi:iron complex outermembrane receptor protein